MAGEQFHTDGRIDQVAIERGGGDRHGFVAAEHFWAVSLAVANARRDVNGFELTGGTARLRFRGNRLEKRREQCSE